MGNMKQNKPKSTDEVKEKLRKDKFGLYVNAPNYAKEKAAILLANYLNTLNNRS